MTTEQACREAGIVIHDDIDVTEPVAFYAVGIAVFFLRPGLDPEARAADVDCCLNRIDTYGATGLVAIVRAASV
jgi:hypothetical protein